MENIFENAYFGKHYRTRDGRKAIYIGTTYRGTYSLHIEKPGSVWSNDIYNKVGKMVNNKSQADTPYDIVSDWHEETDAVSKVCEVYKKELLEIQDTINKVGETLYGVNGLGEILSIEGSVEDFRKALVGHG